MLSPNRNVTFTESPFKDGEGGCNRMITDADFSFKDGGGGPAMPVLDTWQQDGSH